MKKQACHFQYILFLTLTVFMYARCNKPPYLADYTNVKGYVIGKETCNLDETKDYWLLDLTFFPDTPQYGDTVLLNGITYTNVVKVKTLVKELKQVGMRVSINFKKIATNKEETKGCTVNNSITYNLKELFIIEQGEIR
jgi:hypothetical protein